MTDPQRRSTSDVNNSIRVMTRTCLKTFTIAQTLVALQTSVHRCSMSNTLT
jgi:hypothetical protein